MNKQINTAIFLIFLALTQPIKANESESSSHDTDLIEKLESLNSMTQMQMQLDQSRMQSQLMQQLAEIKANNASISARLNQRDNDMSNYIDAISWVSGIVIGFVGILFGIGAFILYRENQDATRKAHQQLDLFNERAEDQQRTFDSWFQSAKKQYSLELEQMSRMMRLRVLLDQEHPNAEDIYPDLSPLFARPKLEYLPIFRKIMSLDLGADISRNTQAAIDHLAERYKEA
jgi:hypothetical protein